MFTVIRFRDFRQQYPRFLPAALLILGASIAVDLLLVERLHNYDEQIDSIRGGMTDIQRQRGTAVQDTRSEQERLMLEIVRRQALGAAALHLAVSVDSGTMTLMRRPVPIVELLSLPSTSIQMHSLALRACISK